MQASRRRDAVQEGLRQSSPRTLEAQLARTYGKLNRRALELVDLLLMPAIRANDNRLIAIAMAKIEEALAQDFSDDKIKEVATSMADRINANHSKKFFSALGTAIGMTIVGSDSPKKGIMGGGVGMPPIVGPPGFQPPQPPRRGRIGVKISVAPELFADEFARKNVSLIGELRSGIKAGLEDAVVRAKQFGGSPDELADRLRDSWRRKGIPSQLPIERYTLAGRQVTVSTDKHATLVAQDQIGKLNAQLNQARQEEAGITRFTWITMGDDRVRPEHEALHGKVFAWEDGAPGEGLPGEAVRCRCVAEAVIDRDQILSEGSFVEL